MSDMAEGVVPHIVHDEIMPDVVVGIAVVVLANVRGILGEDDVRELSGSVQAKWRQRVVGNFIQGMAPGIAGMELKAAGEGVIRRHSKAVIVGVGDILGLLHGAETRVRYCGREIREGCDATRKLSGSAAPGVQSSIRNFFMGAVIADI